MVFLRHDVNGGVVARGGTERDGLGTGGQDGTFAKVQRQLFIGDQGSFRHGRGLGAVDGKSPLPQDAIVVPRVDCCDIIIVVNIARRHGERQDGLHVLNTVGVVVVGTRNIRQQASHCRATAPSIGRETGGPHGGGVVLIRSIQIDRQQPRCPSHEPRGGIEWHDSRTTQPNGRTVTVKGVG